MHRLLLLLCLGVQHVHASVAASRQIAHRVLSRCLKSDAFADRALHSELAKADLTLSDLDRAKATELVYGVMRTSGSLDYQLELLTSPGLAKKTQHATLCALRMGAYEIMHQNTPDFAAVNEAVSLAGSQKSQRAFTNGVLRNLARRKGGGELTPATSDESLSQMRALAIETSTPEWLLKELSSAPAAGGSALLGSFDELAAWAHASQQRPSLALRVNRARATRDDVCEALRDAGLRVEVVEDLDDALLLDTGGGQVTKLPGFAEGWWSVQDVGAQVVALLAAPWNADDAAGQTVVLDLCAAPGGKSTHLAELLHARGHADARVLSVEVHAAKARLIEGACERLGLDGTVGVHVADATSPEALTSLLSAEVGPDALADAVLLDAPCSGLGTLRRNPEHRYRPASAASYRALCELQATLLDSAAGALRVGGTLTYSVCSPILAETETCVAAFLARHAGRFEVAPANENSAVPSEYVADSAALGAGSIVRTWTHQHQADSHFAVALRRIA